MDTTDAPYDQLSDTDDLIVAKEELESLYEWLSQRGDEDDHHGLDTAIKVLELLIEKNSAEAGGCEFTHPHPHEWYCKTHDTTKIAGTDEPVSCS